MTKGVTKAEAIQAIAEPALSLFFNTVEAADDAYVQSSPPMSPLTKNYFKYLYLRRSLIMSQV